MNAVILILKGLLVWITTFLFLLYLSCLESLIEQNYTSLLLIFTVILFTLLILCNVNISEKDLKIVSGYNVIKNYFK